MTNEDKFIVAIVLGSSKISTVVGRKEPDGAIKVLMYFQDHSSSFIRKGRINNVKKMKACLAGIKEKLENKLQKSVGCVYVGVGGMGVHSVPNTVTRHLEEKQTITEELVNDISMTNRMTSSADQEILESVILDYKVGTQLTTDPVGMQGESIEGRFLNIVGNNSIRESIVACFKEVGLKVAGMPIAVQALSNCLLNDTEKSSGCVLVDMGAETTTVAVYKNRLLRHFAVLPLGGCNVNRDITSLQIEDLEAEQLKLQYGEAIYDPAENKRENITLNDGRTLPFGDFSNLVEARMEEIIMNVDHQVKLSKYDKDSLIGGIFLTGGASEMKGLEKAIRSYTEFTTLKHKKEISLQLRGSNIAELKKDTGYSTALSIIDLATENCCAGNLGSANNDLFDAENRKKEEERLAQEEAERKAQEEAERKAREEAERIAQEEAERLAREEEKKKKPGFFSRIGDSAKKIGKKLSDMVGDE